VIDLSVGRDPSALIVMINPEFVERDGMQLEEEGCLSVPGFTRPSCGRHARRQRLDRSGNEQQHEAPDSCAGISARDRSPRRALFVDRLRGIKRDLIVRRIKKLTRAGKW